MWLRWPEKNTNFFWDNLPGGGASDALPIGQHGHMAALTNKCLPLKSYMMDTQLQGLYNVLYRQHGEIEVVQEPFLMK